MMLDKMWLLQAVKGKASGKGKETVNDKPRMLGCLDIDFSYWNAADIARQWNALANKDAGASSPLHPTALHTSLRSLPCFMYMRVASLMNPT